MAIMGFSSISHWQVATLTVCALILFFANGGVQGRSLTEATTATGAGSLAQVERACASYTGVCNESQTCVAAIRKYREEVYGVADYCDCANAIGYDLVDAYPTVTPAVTYISNCIPDCIYGEECPFVSKMIAILGNGGARGAASCLKSTNLTGVAVVQLKMESKEIKFNLTSAALTANVINAGLEVTIKKGTPDIEGTVVVTLSTGAPGAVAGSVKLADFQVAKDIAYIPQEYYIDVRTKPANAGFLRGTLAASAAVMAKVSSAACVPSSSAGASAKPATTGFISLVTDTFRLCYKVRGIVNGTHKGASVGKGAMCGVNSTVAVPLFGGVVPPTPEMAGCGTPLESSILELLAKPSAFFTSLNVSSALNSTSVVTLKGALTTKVALTATLELKSVVPQLAGKKEGGEEEKSEDETTVDLVVGEGYGCFSFTPGTDFKDATSAYLRAGARNVTGEVLAMLFQGVTPPPTTGCVFLDNEIIASIAADPVSYYVTMNTVEKPLGAGRGQLQYV